MEPVKHIAVIQDLEFSFDDIKSKLLLFDTIAYQDLDVVSESELNKPEVKKLRDENVITTAGFYCWTLL
jgi:hypothetical protein